MQSKNEKTGVPEEQAQNPEQITKTQIVFGDPASAAIVAADEINRLHHEIDNMAITALEKAIRIGELLAEQHARCKHGEWLPWLKANVQFGQATAYNYQRLYRERGKFTNVVSLAEAYRLLTGSPERGQKTGDRVDQATKPPARVRQYLKVHFRNAPDRDNFAKLVGQEIYDHTRELDFPKVEDVVIDVAPVVDHDNQLLADAQAQWTQFCESHPFHPPVKLAQIQMAMLLAMYRLYQNIAPSLPPPAVAQTMSPRQGSGKKKAERGHLKVKKERSGTGKVPRQLTGPTQNS